MFKFLKNLKNDQEGAGLLIMIIVSTFLAAAAYYIGGVSTNAVKEAKNISRQGEIADLEKFIRNNISCSKTLDKNTGSSLFLYNKSGTLLMNRHSTYTDSMSFYQWLIQVESYDSSTKTYNIKVADAKKHTKWIKLFKVDPLECK